MKDNIYGETPYRSCNFGSASESYIGYESEISEIKLLRALLYAFKNGDFNGVSELIMMVDSPNYDVRQYCHQLLACVCCHSEIDEFRRILNVDFLEVSEVERVVMRLGESLSLMALPVIFDLVNMFDDQGLNDYALIALSNIFPWDNLDDDDFFKSEKKEIYIAAASEMDPHHYYYRGKPVFVGDITKELVGAATVSYNEHKQVILEQQAYMLSQFSGIQCPIKYTDMIGDTEMSRVLAYAQAIAEIQAWQKGTKYFYTGTPRTPIT